MLDSARAKHRAVQKEVARGGEEEGAEEGGRRKEEEVVVGQQVREALFRKKTAAATNSGRHWGWGLSRSRVKVGGKALRWRGGVYPWPQRWARMEGRAKVRARGEDERRDARCWSIKCCGQVCKKSPVDL